MATITDIQLSDEQRNVVDCDSLAIVVTASAGSGKTEVVASRVERLLQDDADGASRVLALSYTVKAADELRQRFDDRLGQLARRVDAETLHGFAHEILRKDGTWIGLPPEPELLSRDEDRVELLARALRDQGASFAVDDLPLALREIDLCRSRNQTDAQWLDEWRHALDASGALDFPAMLERAIELFELPAIRRQTSRRYRHVIVDESQNLTPLQYRLLTSLVGPPPLDDMSLMLIGDDKQSIVGFSGADPELIARFQSDFAASAFHLSRNYRSAHRIVQVSERVAAELGRSQQATDVVYPAKGAVQVHEAADEHAEGEVVASWIANLLADGLHPDLLVPGEAAATRAEQLAVLGRSAASLRSTQEALRSRNIAVATSVGMDDWLTSTAGAVVLEILATRVADHVAPRWQLSRILDVPVEDLPDLESVEKVLAERTDNLTELAPLCHSADPEALISDLDAANIADDPEWQGDRVQLGDAWRRFKLQADVAPRSWANFRTFLTRLQRGNDLTSGVRLLTVHKAQGREYRAVAVVGLNDGQFPDFRVQSAAEKKGELRAFYVAVTRPTRLLLLTRPRRRATRYGQRAADASPFLELARPFAW